MTSDRAIGWKARAVAAALTIVAVFPATAFCQTAGSAASGALGDRVVRWATLVREHAHGSGDAALLEIARWPDADIESVAVEIKRLAAFLNRVRQNRAGPNTTIEIDGRSFSGDGLRELFGIAADQFTAEGANPILHEGAILHGDIAALLPDESGSGNSRESTFVVEDGRQRGVTYPTIHWAVGRSLLDAIVPSPGSDFATLMWYRDASAQMLHVGALSESARHLERAFRLFPKDREFLLDRAYLHERLASPVIQAGVESVFRSRGMRTDVGSQRAELEQAERWFRQTLAVDPGNAPVRIRLGRILAELGRLAEAVQELRSASAQDISPYDAYLAHLFLGRAEELLGHREAARESFQRASTLYPLAQSPHLALSRLTSESGDRRVFLQSLDALAELPADERTREDPWWHYYEVR